MSLSSFGKTSSASEEKNSTPPVESIQKTEPTQKAKLGKKSTAKVGKTATLNIQVTRAQQRWLQNTAQDIRDNNDGPVPGPQRVYPVHLIQAAIDLLRTQDIVWDEIKDVEGLKDALNL
ncbi:MAG: hypothetical protein HC800_22305 [Phormidesmis sp. RL_2_1]|nr:hypothetical protein [Phormidesmis sp. RL_2_1]